MRALRDVGCRGCLPDCHRTVMTAAACPANIRMIKAAVRVQLQKCDGIVAVTAFGLRWLMKHGFTDCGNTVVALAAISEYFLMIDSGDNVESLRGMAGLARITGADVNRPFTRNRNEIIVMTIHAI